MQPSPNSIYKHAPQEYFAAGPSLELAYAIRNGKVANYRAWRGKGERWR